MEHVDAWQLVKLYGRVHSCTDMHLTLRLQATPDAS